VVILDEATAHLDSTSEAAADNAGRGTGRADRSGDRTLALHRPAADLILAVIRTQGPDDMTKSEMILYQAKYRQECGGTAIDRTWAFFARTHELCGVA
jgi:hypothetical protein